MALIDKEKLSKIKHKATDLLKDLEEVEKLLFSYMNLISKNPI